MQLLKRIFLAFMLVVLLAGCSAPQAALNVEGPCYKVAQAQAQAAVQRFAARGTAQAAGQPTPSAAPDSRPNILLILTDDLDSELLAHTPNIQKLLVEQGVSFQNYLINVPQCCPSRSTILLGQYSQNTGILRNGGDEGGFKTFFKNGLEKQTIAYGLQLSGYRTVLLGKYLNGYPGDAKKRVYIPPGWDEWYVPAVGSPYSSYNYKLNENGTIVNYHKEAADYMTDVLAGKADDFLQRTAGDNQPFFMYLSLYAPHGPAAPAPRHAGLFADAQAPRPPSFNEADVSDKPAFLRDLPLLDEKAIQGIDHFYRSRLQSMQAVDEMVARLVQTLQDTGQLDNTYILFTSDNGLHLGQHRMEAGKLAPYEEDVRVPLVVRGPGLPAGTQTSQIAGNVDLAATFGEMAGLKTGAACDGRSLLPLLRGAPAGEWRSAYPIAFYAGRVSAYQSNNGSGDNTLEPPDDDPSAGEEDNANIPAFHAVRTDKYLYVEYATGEKELYDLQADPYQLENLAASADPALLQQLAMLLKTLSSCKGEACWKKGP
jgi:arylsulfatase A-like enzyme